MVINSTFQVLGEQGIKDFIKLAGLSYPSTNLNTPEDIQRMVDKYLKIQNEDPTAKIYGAFRNDQMLGGMQLHDFIFNFNGKELPAGGVGFVAVDLLHKKERIAKDIISYFIDHYRQRKVAVAMLYPFRPDFYKKMGFGYGTKMNQYKVKPATLPKMDVKENLSYYTEQDKEQLIDCYNRFAARTHGMIKRTNIEISNIIAPGKNSVVYKKEGKIEGYVSFFFKKATEVNAFKNDIVVRELIYDNLEVFKQLLNFLHTQFDQIETIIFHTQDEYFHYLLSDPRDGSSNHVAPLCEQTNLQGLGVMYRVIDIAEFFSQLAEYHFGNQDITLKLNIADSFVEENSKPLLVQFRGGQPQILESSSFDAEISMDISDFSSMVMGSVEFNALLRLGLVQISEEGLADRINELFRSKVKPMCTTLF